MNCVVDQNPQSVRLSWTYLSSTVTSQTHNKHMFLVILVCQEMWASACVSRRKKKHFTHSSITGSEFSLWSVKWFFFSLCAYSLYDVKSDTVCACMFSKLRRKCVQHKLSAHVHTHTLCVHSETWSCPHLYNLMKFVNRKANGCFDESSALKWLKDYLLTCVLVMTLLTFDEAPD